MPDKGAEILQPPIRTYQVKARHVKGVKTLKDF